MGNFGIKPISVRLVPAVAGASGLIMLAFVSVFVVGQWFEYRSAIDIKRAEMLEDAEIIAGYTAELIELGRLTLERETEVALANLPSVASSAERVQAHPMFHGEQDPIPVRFAVAAADGTVLYHVGAVDQLLNATAIGEVPLPGTDGSRAADHLMLGLISPTDDPGSRWLRLSRRVMGPRSSPLWATVFINPVAVDMPPRLNGSERLVVDFELDPLPGSTPLPSFYEGADSAPMAETTSPTAAMSPAPAAGASASVDTAWLAASFASLKVPVVVTIRAPLNSVVSYWQTHHRKMLGLVMTFGVVLAGVTAFSWLLVVRPIRSIRRAVSRIQAGKLGTSVKIRPSLLDIRELAQGIEQMRSSLFDLTRNLQVTIDARTEELALKNQQFLLALRHMSHGLIMFDPLGRVTVSNENCYSILNLPPALGVPGTHISSILRAFVRRHREMAPSSVHMGNMLRCAVVSLSARQGEPVELRLPEGRVVRIRGTLKPSSGLLATVEDVTEDRRLEQELRDTATAAQQASRAKSEFLANMSHELRTPLNSVIGFSELILSEVGGPLDNQNYVEYLRNINASGQHLLDLINDILDLSKAEAGRLEIVAANFDVTELVQTCIALVGEAARQNGVSLSTRLDEAIPPVWTDERRLRQILLNLLSNAIKFTKSGGEVLLEVHLAASAALQFVVVDTGIGMSGEDIPIALEPFRQIDSSLNRRFEGTGLGLPLTRRLVELLGGTFTIRSVLGQGTTVEVTLPVAQDIPALVSGN